jgi:RNA polymerase sigma-70 factor, ECF subfamily
LKALQRDSDERHLVEAAQKDPVRFAGLYESNFERVYAYILRRVRDREETEDLTAEVFHQALAHLNNFEWRGLPFSAWLFRIASNSIADRWKRVAKESGNPVDEETPGRGPSPEEIEHQASVFRQVATLPVDQRRVIEMRFAQEKSIREISRELGRTEGAVKQLQFRGIDTLRKQLAQTSKKESRRKSGEPNG